MMNRIFRYILISFLCVATVACSDEINAPQNGPLQGVAGKVTIRFNNSDCISRSEESDNSETLIEKLFVALYPMTPDETVPAVTVGKFTDLTDHNSSTVSLQLTRQMETELFNRTDGNKCKMYALANVSDDDISSLPENPTISDLKNLSISSLFATNKEQPSFVMAGEGEVTYTAGNPGQAIGEGDLYRAAAKIRLNLRLPESLTPPGKTEVWKPKTDEIKCLLVNGVKDAVTAPVPDAEGAPWLPANDAAYFNGSLSEEGNIHLFVNNGDTGKDAYPYEIDVPFYTYPNAWEETPDEVHKTTMTLIVPWQLEGSETETRRNYYYQVPVTPTELTQINRNYSYTVNLNVGMLGSLDPDTPLPLENLTYQVVNWSTENIEVSLNDYRYLVVNPNVYTMNNETDIKIPFYTSHPVTLKDITITYERFNFISIGSNPNVGRVISVNINEEQIDRTNNNTYENSERKHILDVSTDIDNSNQNIIVLHHPLTLWDPRADYGEPDEDDDGYTDAERYAIVSLTGRTSGSSETSFNAEVTRVTNLIKFYTPTYYPAYSPYIIRLHIEHSDNSSFAEDITITQYPAMYIQADRNPNSYLTSSSTPPPYGNVYVNGVWSSREAEKEPGYYDLGNIRGISSNAQNQNPNMYVITTTQLSSGSEYVIGDPRSLFYTNDLSETGDLNPTENGSPAGDWCTPAYAMYPGSSDTRTLSYYYPTIETSVTENMIAPKLRIASSWGIGSLEEELYQDEGVMQRTRVMSRRRAATYQEQGYPAGRWRLPTLAEFKYIVQLSIDKKIPELYTSVNQIYWTAQGAYYISADAGSVGKILPAPPPKVGSRRAYYNIRPVYDEWYWNESKYKLKPYDSEVIPKYSYTLGDIPRGMQ